MFDLSKYPEFKIGDEVRIRSWDDLVSEFGLNDAGNVASPMGSFGRWEKDLLCGEIGIIAKVSVVSIHKSVFEEDQNINIPIYYI